MFQYSDYCFFLLIAVFRDTLLHWSGPGQIALIILGAAFLKNKTIGSRKYWLIGSSFVFLIVVIGGFLIIHYFPGTIGSKEILTYGEEDVTLDMYGWVELKDYFKPIYESSNRDSNIKSINLIVSNK